LFFERYLLYIELTCENKKSNPDISNPGANKREISKRKFLGSDRACVRTRFIHDYEFLDKYKYEKYDKSY
jgi:hypothetical protein